MIVPRSPTKAEYQSMTTTTCKLKWLKNLLSSLDVAHPTPMHLYCDSQATLYLVKILIFHKCTKHIIVDCHFADDKILRGNIHPVHVSTQV